MYQPINISADESMYLVFVTTSITGIRLNNHYSLADRRVDVQDASSMVSIRVLSCGDLVEVWSRSGSGLTFLNV